ncbi:MAG: Ppx/GppA family phosphatase [Limibacillus sp.]|jgi:exopolyphosphatase/guanosine-5'-triphosphate,3'-diphosphate pyrophosphatase
MKSLRSTHSAALDRGRPAAEPRLRREAVVDIGSNSIRLVVFERLSRSLVPVFNEKVLCGLARGMDEGGKLNAEGVEMALANLYRFVRLCEATGVDDIEMLATAAVRDAANGEAFVKQVEKRTGHKIRVLSGDEEARFAAYGVVAAMPKADGVVGDLGGGSLELISLNQGRLGASVTLPLGLLRLSSDTISAREDALKKIDDALADVDWLGSQPGRNFYAVGGAWRSLAKVHIEQTNYPLHVIHGYSQPMDEMDTMLGVVSRLSKRSLSQFSSVSKRRIDTLPMAATVLSRVLRASKAKDIVFCAYGLREGSRYDKLTPEERELDPLAEMAAELARREGRFGDIGEVLFHWVAALFPDEAAEAERLRRAACLLSDVAWREHPDYRAEQAYLRLLRQPMEGADHQDRAFLALSCFVRYGGGLGNKAVDSVRELLPAKRQREAVVLGSALRLGYTLSGGTNEVLHQSRLTFSEKKREAALELDKDAWVPGGDVVERRLSSLNKALENRGQED